MANQEQLELSGASVYRRITIRTQYHEATARYEPDGSISCRIKPRKQFNLALLQKNKITLPWLIPLYGLLYAFTLWVGRGHVGLSDWSSLQSNLTEFGKIYIVSLAVGLVIILVYRFRGAAWHGAEHMAIMAFNVSGATTIDAIRGQSRVIPACGSRFFLPILGVFFPLWLLGYAIPLPFDPFGLVISVCLGLLVAVVLTIALVLVEAGTGWDKAPLLGQGFYWLQRHLATSQPGETELLVAQQALRAVVEAAPGPE